MAKAAVEVVEPTGAETHAVLKLGDQEIVGRFDPDNAPRLGELLSLGFDMSHACLFDPATQALIPWPTLDFSLGMTPIVRWA